MKSRFSKFAIAALCALFVSVTALDDSWARSGGGKSFGSRGSRTMTAPTRTDTTQPARPAMQPAPQQTMPSPAMSQPGFGRTLLTAVAGGLIGSMLFGGLVHAAGGMGGFGGSGFGLIEILLVCGLLFFVFRMFRRKKEEAYAYQRQGTGYNQPPAADVYTYGQSGAATAGASDLSIGLDHVRQMDPSFDETRFKDQVTDLFFKVQSAWGNRDLSIASGHLTDEITQSFKADIDEMKRSGRINRLDNIAVRKVEITEAWQETGQDFITVLYTANLLDYTIDERTGSLVSGSRTEPVKFEEFWTYTRPAGPNAWKLSAINQVS